MWKRTKKILALGLAAALLLTGCGSSEGLGGDSLTGQTGAAGNTEGQDSGGSAENDQKTMGRYMESDIALPEEINFGRDMWLTDDGLELVAWDGSLYRSQDQ